MRLLSSLSAKIARTGFAFVGLVCCAWGAGAGSIEDAPYHYSSWETQDGLPANKVMAIVQTRDGYFWAGTYEGLVKFDGVAFTPVHPPAGHGDADTSVTALCESPDGTLWIGHESGSVTSYKGGKFAFFPRPNSGTTARVQRVAADDRGDVWSLDVGGTLLRVRDRRVLSPASGGARGVFDMVRANNGTLWINCRGTLSVLAGGELSIEPQLPEMGGFVQGICPSQDGGVWVVAGEQLWKYVDGRWSEPYGRLVTGLSPLSTFAETRNGDLVAGTFEQGAVVISPKPFIQQRLWRRNGFPSDWILSAQSDHEGSLWLATGTAGLFRLRDERVRMLLPADHWEGRAVLSAARGREGSVWVGTEGAGVYRLSGKEWTRYGSGSGLENLYVWSVREDLAGNLFVGTWGGGLYRLRGDRFVKAEGTEGVEIPVAALTPSARGGMLAGTLLGAFHYRDGEMRWLETDASRRLRDVRFLLEEPNGAVWVACNGDGLGRIEKGVARQYLPQDGLSSPFVRSLHRTADGTLWIGTRDGGLNRLKDGKFTVLTTAQGLIDDTISFIEDDGLGFLWLGTHRGLMRISLEELNACAEGRIPRLNPLSYGINDGLLTLASSGPLQPAGFQQEDGKLIFATSRGLARVDPSDVQLNTQPPPVKIRSVKVGDMVVLDETTPRGLVDVGPGQHRIEVSYTALSFAAPEKVRFRQRLSGGQQEYVHVGEERSAVYSFVPPGTYTFQVTASNNDNVWNEVGDSVKIRIRPHFWQTAWFRSASLLALVAAAAGVAWSVSRRRLKRKLQRLERARAIEAERARIAHDMHDDLGAHLTRITMLSDAARSQLDERERLGEDLEEIYETARNVTRSMDEIVWAVNPRHDTLESLVFYLEKFAQDFLGAAGIRVRLNMPLQFADWKPSSDVRHNLFLCYKEALNNVVRHSGADLVMVSLNVDETHCTIEVRDNGRGAEPPAGARAADAKSRTLPSSGNGLENLRRRMVEIGGSCDFASEPNRGFTVTLKLPVSRAGLRPVAAGPVNEKLAKPDPEP